MCHLASLAKTFWQIAVVVLLQVDYHGQQDDVEEGNTDESLNQGNFGEIQSFTSSKSSGTVSAESGDHLFFEDLVRLFTN